MPQNKQKAKTTGKKEYSKSQETSEYNSIQQSYNALYDDSLTRLLYCPSCLSDGRISRTIPDGEVLNSRRPGLVMRCNSCKELTPAQDSIGLDELLQALFNMVLIHKSPQELMEHIENIKDIRILRRREF